MCRTLRGGRAEAITTLIPRRGRPSRAIAVWRLTRLESFSRVPSRSIATKPMSRFPEGSQVGTVRVGLLGGMGWRASAVIRPRLVRIAAKYTHHHPHV